MKTMSARIRALFLFACTFLVFSGSAHAQCDMCVTRAIISTATIVTQSISVLQTSIVDAVRGNSQAVATATTKSAQAVAAQVGQAINQAKIDEVDKKYEHPDECAAVAASDSMDSVTRSPGSGSSGGGRGGASLGGGTGISRGSAEVNDSAAGRAPPKAPEIQAAKAVANACSDFADSALRKSNCIESGLNRSPGANSGLPDADIRAETIFDGPQRQGVSGKIESRLTVSPNSKEASAIDSYMRNLNTPIELRQLSPSELSSQAGRQYLSFKDSYEARMSLAEKPIRALNARRLADTSTIKQITTLMGSDTANGPHQWLANYLTKYAPNWRTTGVSADELLRIEVDRRYMNEDWQVKMATLDIVALMREQVINSAFQNYLLMRLINGTEQNGVLQSQTASSAVRAEMTPQLNALHTAATGR